MFMFSSRVAPLAYDAPGAPSQPAKDFLDRVAFLVPEARRPGTTGKLKGATLSTPSADNMITNTFAHISILPSPWRPSSQKADGFKVKMWSIYN